MVIGSSNPASTTMATTAAMPDGMQSLPDPNEWNGHSVAACLVIATGLAGFFVGLRFWARAGILGVVRREDWVILGALVWFYSSTGCRMSCGNSWSR